MDSSLPGEILWLNKPLAGHNNSKSQQREHFRETQHLEE
jgi:hypothetical protein